MRLIYTMHMPLFMGLCGYLFYFFYSEVVICSYVCHKEAAFQAGRADHSYDFFWPDQDCLRCILEYTYTACNVSFSQVLVFFS